MTSLEHLTLVDVDMGIDHFYKLPGYPGGMDDPEDGSGSPPALAEMGRFQSALRSLRGSAMGLMESARQSSPLVRYASETVLEPALAKVCYCWREVG